MTFGAVAGSDSIASTSPGTGITCATGWTAAVGDLVIVAVAKRGSVPASPSIADGLGNSYTPLNTYDAGNATVSAWYSIITTGGTCKPGITQTSTSDDEALVAVGFNGPFDSGGALDKDVNGVTDTSTPFLCPATGTLARAEELIIGYGAIANGLTTINATSPMSMRKEANSGTGSNTVSVHLGSWIVNATDSVQPEFNTGSPGSAGWKTATFKGIPPVIGIKDESTEASEAFAKARARTRYYNDTIQQGEVFQRPGTWVRPIPETVDIQYDRKRLLVRIRHFADAVNSNEFIDYMRTIFKWRSHTIETGETQLYFRGLFRVLAETAEGAETFVKLVTRALPQLFVAWFELQAVRTDIPFIPAILEVIDEAAEAAEGILSGRLRSRVAYEAVQQAEARNSLRALLRRWAASVEQAEGKLHARARVRRRAETAETGETFKRLLVRIRRFADSIEAGETKVLTIGKFVISFSTVQAAEVLSLVRGRIASYGDTVAYGDIVVKTRGFVRRIAAQVEAAETRVWSIGLAYMVDEVMRVLDNPTFVSTLMFLRPTLTYTSGSWTDELGSGINIHDSIDEEAPSDADWIVSSPNPEQDITLFNLVGPQFQLIEPCSLRIRARAATPASRLTVKVLDGETELITREVEGLTQDYQTIVFPLTGADFLALRDATERRLMLIANHTE